MIRLLTDENIPIAVVRAVKRRRQDVDILSVNDVGLRQTPDPKVLEWAANDDRIVVTYDRSTMIDDAIDRILKGLPMPGLFVLSPNITIGQTIDSILFVNDGSAHEEWRDLITYLPL